MIVKNRIKDHSEFQEVIAKGLLERTKSLAIYYLNNDLGYTRIGISVPKKSGNAVVRNKIKRQIRAICALTTDFSKSVDIVFIIRKGYDVKNFNGIKEEIKNFLENR